MALPKAGAPKTRRSAASYLNLSAFREKRGLSLEEIAERTKISIRFLRAIEEADYQKLPGGIFATSYLKQYSAAIGFAESELLAHYALITNPPVNAASVATPASRGILDRWFRVNAEVQRT